MLFAYRTGMLKRAKTAEKIVKRSRKQGKCNEQACPQGLKAPRIGLHRVTKRTISVLFFYWPNMTIFRRTDVFQAVIPVTMETRCFHKKLEFQRYPPKDFCTARYEYKSSKKKSQNFSKTPKKNPGPILGQDRPEKNSAKCWFEAARFRVLDRHRSTKPRTAP